MGLEGCVSREEVGGSSCSRGSGSFLEGFYGHVKEGLGGAYKSISSCAKKAAVGGLAGVVFLASASYAADATLAWDPNSEDNLAGYKLYYDNDGSGAPYDGTGANEGSSPVYIYLEDLEDDQDPVYSLTGLSEGLHYFALTAFDTDGLESDYSDEVSAELEDEKETNLDVNGFTYRKKE